MIFLCFHLQGGTFFSAWLLSNLRTHTHLRSLLFFRFLFCFFCFFGFFSLMLKEHYFFLMFFTFSNSLIFFFLRKRGLCGSLLFSFHLFTRYLDLPTPYSSPCQKKQNTRGKKKNQKSILSFFDVVDGKKKEGIIYVNRYIYIHKLQKYI